MGTDRRQHARQRGLGLASEADLAAATTAMAAGDALDDRNTYPGHVTTSAIVVTPSTVPHNAPLMVAMLNSLLNILRN